MHLGVSILTYSIYNMTFSLSDLFNHNNLFPDENKPVPNADCQDKLHHF